MKNEISDALDSVLLFFERRFIYVKRIYPIRDFLELPIIKMVHQVSYKINEKYNGDYSYLIISNSDESLKIVFVGKHFFHSDRNLFAMFCVNGDGVWEYQNNIGQTFLLKSSFSGYVGLNMIAVAKKFCEGVIESDLKISESELIEDVLEHSKNIA